MEENQIVIFIFFSELDKATIATKITVDISEIEVFSS